MMGVIKMRNKDVFHSLQQRITQDMGNRGISKIADEKDFQEAIVTLHGASSVMIVTGFCIKDTMTGETDGPMGAVALASGLQKLGKEVVLISDQYSEELLMACCKVLETKVPIEIVPYDGAEAFCVQLLDQYKPSHVVALERPGRAADGGCYSMRGEDLGVIIPDTDILLKESKQRGITTVAIGDGGNEMGMGKVKSVIAQLVPEGERITAVTEADYLIIADISNWGGYAIVAGLSILTSQQLLHNEESEKNMLKAMIDVGGVDGCTKMRELTVDGLSLEVNLDILKGLQEIVREHLGNSEEIIRLKNLQYS